MNKFKCGRPNFRRLATQIAKILTLSFAKLVAWIWKILVSLAAIILAVEAVWAAARSPIISWFFG